MTKVEYYLNIAKDVAQRSPCSRRRFGVVIVKDDIIVATGYNGTVRGALNCGVDIPCIKDVAAEPAYVTYEHCPAVHAEENACFIAGRKGGAGATLYLAPCLGVGDRPCYKCRRAIIQCGIEKVIYVNRDGKVSTEYVRDWLELENKWMTDHLDKLKPNWKEEMLK